jgi:hypothetical protein
VASGREDRPCDREEKGEKIIGESAAFVSSTDASHAHTTTVNASSPVPQRRIALSPREVREAVVKDGVVVSPRRAHEMSISSAVHAANSQPHLLNASLPLPRLVDANLEGNSHAGVSSNFSITDSAFFTLEVSPRGATPCVPAKVLRGSLQPHPLQLSEEEMEKELKVKCDPIETCDDFGDDVDFGA